MCAYTTSTFLGSVLRTITYTYGEPDWKDLLTAYDGIQLYYDGIGNLTSDGTWTYTWQAGRQLSEMRKTGSTIVYRYDHNDLRTSKAITENNATITTNYIYNGNLLVHMTKGSDSMRFFYDAQGWPAMVDYNGTK